MLKQERMVHPVRPGLGAGMAFGSSSGANKNIRKWPWAESVYGGGKRVCVVCVCVCWCGAVNLTGVGGSQENEERR